MARLTQWPVLQIKNHSTGGEHHIAFSSRRRIASPSQPKRCRQETARAQSQVLQHTRRLQHKSIPFVKRRFQSSRGMHSILPAPCRKSRLPTEPRTPMPCLVLMDQTMVPRIVAAAEVRHVNPGNAFDNARRPR